MKVRDRRFHLAKHSGRGYWGKRCSYYANCCIGCAAWRFYDSKGRFPYSYDEANDYRASLNEDPLADDWERHWHEV